MRKKVEQLELDLVKLREQLAKVKQSVSQEYTVTNLKVAGDV